ncbi:hypothetical protein CLOM_g18477 [Closterium sp. NIES-68]|nr:hypothetical protein CLOM_g18477 [Closterium sp. NIES-68]GJP69516.1 hypothetical protein CLOP_g521 [Closterium sp. NIES-67]
MAAMESPKKLDSWPKSLIPRQLSLKSGASPSLLKSSLPYAIAIAVITAIIIPVHLTIQSNPGLMSLVWSHGGGSGSHQPPPLGWAGRMFSSMSGIDAALCRADVIFWENVARRKAIFQGAFQPKLGNPVWMKELVLIPTYPCPVNERIGKWGDGGKWTCLLPNAIQKTNPVVYSVGSFGMYSFEQSMYKILGAKPYTFDPFLNTNKREIMANLTCLHFNEIGLSGAKSLPAYKKSSPDKKFSTLPDLMRQFGHTYVDVFKIDCEGCEEELVKDLGAAHLNTGNKLTLHGGRLPFGQILIEFHHTSGPVRTLETFYTLERLGYRMFSIEYNPYCVNCVEMSFIHESLVRPNSDTDCRPFLTPALEDEGEKGETKTEVGGGVAGGNSSVSDSGASVVKKSNG